MEGYLNRGRGMVYGDPMNQPVQKLTTNRKALSINMDSLRYGTFAEIGAGQEVARHFFHAGGAAGTVAKSMSAYDMKFSDEIYGKAERYVSKDRLMQMLQHEYHLLETRLRESRGNEATFFVYANTVAARSYRSPGPGHGWMGVRFQSRPGEPALDIILHLRMVDDTVQQQQETLGIVGVNLIYGAFYLSHDSDAFIRSLKDNLEGERLEIDLLEVHGEVFPGVDNRILGLKLVEADLGKAVFFSPEGKVLQPAETFYRKAVLLQRGSFRPITKVNQDMVECAARQLWGFEGPEAGEPEVVFEMTMRQLSRRGRVDYRDFLHRVDAISALGHTVMVSNYFEFYRLSGFFRRYTPYPLAIVLGVKTLAQIFKEEYYAHLEGGILESFGRLFKERVRLFIHPMLAENFASAIPEDLLAYGYAPADQDAHELEDGLITARTLKVEKHLRHLYAFLYENGFLVAVEGFDRGLLECMSRDAFEKIRSGSGGWERIVPEPVVRRIKEHRLWEPGT